MTLSNIHENLERDLKALDKNIIVERIGSRVESQLGDYLFISQSLPYMSMLEFEDMICDLYGDYILVQDYAVIGYCYNVILRRPNNEPKDPHNNY